MINDDLEKLLNRYMQGDLDFTSYRQQRYLMLREFVDDKKPDVTIPQNHEQTKTLNTPVQKTPEKFQVPTIVRDEPLSTTRRLQISVVAGLIGLAIGAWLLSESQVETATPSIQERAKITENKVKTPTKNPPFIEEFLSKDLWDTESLSDVLLAWQNLPLEQQILARDSEAFKQLHERLVIRMDAVSKLKNIGEKNAEKQEQLLIWFATQMGIKAVER